jgi:hypothetical protein
MRVLIRSAAQQSKEKREDLNVWGDTNRHKQAVPTEKRAGQGSKGNRVCEKTEDEMRTNAVQQIPQLEKVMPSPLLSVVT